MRWRAWVQPSFLVALLAIVARLVPGPRTIDDAYITFRYAQNLLAGRGLIYNPGQAVLGTTTPLYALILAGLGALSGGSHAPFPLLAVLVNAVFDAATCWLLFRLGNQLGSPRAGVIAALVWAVAPWSVTFAIGGMETSLFVALTSATFYFHSRERPVAAAACGALALLTRPDALILLAPLGLERVRRSLRSGRWNPKPLPISGKELAAFALPVTAWLITATALYGNPLPQTIAAKAAAYRLPPEAALVRLAQHYATPFLENLAFGAAGIAFGLIVYPVLFLVGWLRAVRRLPTSWPGMAFPWLYFAAYAVANPLIFRWYLTPPLPLYMLGIAMGIDRLAQEARVRALPAAFGVVAVALTLHGWTLLPDHGPQRPAPEMAYIQLELLYERVAGDVRGQIGSGQVLAAGDVGTLGYYTGAEMLDTVGLVTREAARYYPIPASSYVINYAIPARLVTDLRPEYLVILEVYGRNTLLVDHSFAAAYRLQETLPTDIYGSRGLLVFRRRDLP